MTFVEQRGNEILKRLPGNRPVCGAEVGVFDGRLSEYLLRRRTDLHLYLVDRWAAVPPDHRYAKSGSQIAVSYSDAEWQQIHRTVIDRVKFAQGRVDLMRGESEYGARQVEAEGRRLDFAFLDADHTKESVLEDLRLWYPLVDDDGWVCGHDWDHPDHLGRWGVREAVEQFFGDAAVFVQTGENRTWFINKAVTSFVDGS